MNVKDGRCTNATFKGGRTNGMELISSESEMSSQGDVAVVEVTKDT